MIKQLLVIFLIVISFVGIPFQANTKITTSKLFTDHMVLQRNQDILVWDWADNLDDTNLYNIEGLPSYPQG